MSDQDISAPVLLLVDDIPENLQVLGQILSERGYNLGYATDGEQALHTALHTVPDLILLDVSMPNMDGFEVCRKLKSQEETREIPIIFLTARHETADIIKGLECGAVDYVTKPFNQAELLTRIQTHLNLSQANKLIRKQNLELQKLNEAKDKFFSLIAHDLKAPFNGLVGLSDLLLRNYDRLDQDEVVEFHRHIYEASKNGLNLLENLLDWARSQTGKMTFEPEYNDLVAVINDKIDLLKINAQQKNIKIKYEGPDAFQAYFDNNMVASVIRNLISNAIKFTPEGGGIYIKLSQDDDMAQVTVQDTGVGMSKDYLDRLFDENDSFSLLGTNQEKGSGLGLLLCFEFIQRNRGQLRVDSLPSKGSTFIFTLPLTEW